MEGITLSSDGWLAAQAPTARRQGSGDVGTSQHQRTPSGLSLTTAVRV